jgi:transcriptional regulator of acetoin/glycerol metabolism
MPAPSLLLSKVSAGGAEERAACKELREIIDDAGGVVEKIAKKLGMNRRSVFRLLRRADLNEYATKAREKSGARDSRNGLSAA